MTPAVFVAGTDTGAGKTHVAVALCRFLRARGLKVAVFKPAETGCSQQAPEDALALREASGCLEPLDVICPYRLPEPLAPAIAAERTGVTIDPRRLDACLTKLRSAHDVVVCEGAGGLLVPFCEGVLTLDWIRAMDLPVLLVGRLGLGTINHTLLSVRAIRNSDVELLGTILSETVPAATVADRTNPHVLRRYAEVKLLGVLAYQQAGDSSLWESILSRLV